MRILHVITTINRGGAENHLVSLVERQVAGGMTVAVAYLQGDGYWRERLEAMCATVVSLGLPLKRYGHPVPIFRLRRFIRDWKPSLVHVHMPPAELYTRLALLGITPRNLPLVITKHNDEPFYRGIGQQWAARWTARRACRIIAISGAVKNYCLDNRIGDSQRVQTIHYGIDPAPYEHVDAAACRSLRRVWGVGDGELLIGCVARLEPQKAIDSLLEGFALCRSDIRRTAKLVIVGRGSLEKKLRKLAAGFCIDSHVIWAGFRDDMPLVMNAIDILALTSAWEGFGLVLLEAMAAGKPVIATHVSAIPEIVVDGITGVLVPPCNPTSIAAAIEFFERAERRLVYGEAGRERVHTAFGLERMAEQTLQIYRECLPRACIW